MANFVPRKVLASINLVCLFFASSLLLHVPTLPDLPLGFTVHPDASMSMSVTAQSSAAGRFGGRFVLVFSGSACQRVMGLPGHILGER